MKYWKGNFETSKEGQFGTMSNDSFVPDSVEISKSEYQNYIESIPVSEPLGESDINKLIKYAKKQKWI